MKCHICKEGVISLVDNGILSCSTNKCKFHYQILHLERDDLFDCFVYNIDKLKEEESLSFFSGKIIEELNDKIKDLEKRNKKINKRNSNLIYKLDELRYLPFSLFGRAYKEGIVKILKDLYNDI